MWCDLWEKTQSMLQRKFYHDISNIQTKAETLLITFKHPDVMGSLFTIINGQHISCREVDEHLPFSYKKNGNTLIITARNKSLTIDFLKDFEIISPEMARKMSEEFPLPITPHHSKTL